MPPATNGAQDRPEGYLRKGAAGRYGLAGRVLTSGSGLLVRAGELWLPMRLEHDGMGYYLLGAGLSFYPKMIYARTAGRRDREKW